MRNPSLAVGPLQVLTHFGGEYEERSDGSIEGFVRERDGRLTPENFYREFAEVMAEVGYEGYTGYELCHPLPKVEGQTVGIDFAHKNARLAARYMRDIVTGVQGARALGTGAARA